MPPPEYIKHSLVSCFYKPLADPVNFFSPAVAANSVGDTAKTMNNQIVIHFFSMISPRKKVSICAVELSVNYII